MDDDVDFVMLENVPAGQEAHTEEPVVEAYFPVLQSVHTVDVVAPTMVENVPAIHVSHILDPVSVS